MEMRKIIKWLGLIITYSIPFLLVLGFIGLLIYVITTAFIKYGILKLLLGILVILLFAILWIFFVTVCLPAILAFVRTMVVYGSDKDKKFIETYKMEFLIIWNNQ